MSSFSRMATVTASTKRSPAQSDGKIGALATHVSSLSCTPLDPVNAEIRTRLGLNTPHEVLQTFVDSAVDIREGDYLVVSGEQYPVRSVGEWTWRGSIYRHVIVEELKV